MNPPRLLLPALALGLLLTPPAGALVLIEGPEDPVLTLDVTRAEGDDAGDTDAKLGDGEVLWVHVDNVGRRWVTVWIDRVWPAHPTARVDNGPDDALLAPGSELSSLSGLGASILGLLSPFSQGAADTAWEWTVSRRAYGLPVPEDVAPGTELVYRVQIVGPAWGGVLPIPPYGPDADPERAPLLQQTLAFTVLNVLLGPVATLAGAELKNTRVLFDAAQRDFLALTTTSPELMNLWNKQDHAGLVWKVLKFCAGSDTVRGVLEARGGAGVLASLAKLSAAFASTGPAAADALLALADLRGANWLEEYRVRVIVPRIDVIDPPTGEVGDLILIHGEGFDPYEPRRNAVYFADETSPGIIIPARAASFVKAESENTLKVAVPSGFYAGPIKVCVEGLCSNQVIFGDELGATVTITAPDDGAAALGEVITVDALIADVPEGYVLTDALARLFVNGERVVERGVTGPELTFSADLSDVPRGEVSLRVDVELAGHVFSDAITIEKKVVVGAFNFARVRAAYMGSTLVTRADGSTYFFPEEDYATGLTIPLNDEEDLRGSMSGLTYALAWGPDDATPDELAGEISLTLAADLGSVVSFSFRRSGPGAFLLYLLDAAITGGGVPLKSEHDTHLAYALEGVAACAAISSVTEHYSGEADGKVRDLVSWYCNADSYLKVDLYVRD